MIAFFAGLVFSVGLGLGGMLNPANVVGFLDVFGNWKPDLALVMASAIPTYAIFVFLSKKMSKPMQAADWTHLPKVGWDISKKALMGSALFGIGWGISGFCPGPALVSVVSLQASVLLFVACMVLGFVVYDKLNLR
jgi:uncharacterized protein